MSVIVDFLGALAIMVKRSSPVRAVKFRVIEATGAESAESASPAVRAEVASLGLILTLEAKSLRGLRITLSPGSEEDGPFSSPPHQNRPATTTTNARAGKNHTR